VGDLAHKMAILMVNKTEMMMIHLQILGGFSPKKHHAKLIVKTGSTHHIYDWGMVINPLGTNPHSVG
jgi:hypothetical protein